MRDSRVSSIEWRDLVPLSRVEVCRELALSLPRADAGVACDCHRAAVSGAAACGRAALGDGASTAMDHRGTDRERGADRARLPALAKRLDAVAPDLTERRVF